MFPKGQFVNSEPSVSESAFQGTASCFHHPQFLCEPGGRSLEIHLPCLDRGMEVKDPAQ